MLFLYSETWPDLSPPLLSRDTINTRVINFARGRAVPSKALSPSVLGRIRPALTPSSWTVGLDRPLSSSAAPLKIPCDLREQTRGAAKTAAKLRPGRCSPSPPGAKKTPLLPARGYWTEGTVQNLENRTKEWGLHYLTDGPIKGRLMSRVGKRIRTLYLSKSVDTCKKKTSWKYRFCDVLKYFYLFIYFAINETIHPWII